MIENLSKFKPLLVFFACICIFISLSCIYASDDIDDAAWNNQGVVDNDLNVEENILSEISSDADIAANSSDEMAEDIRHNKKPKALDGGNIISNYSHSYNVSSSHMSDIEVVYPMSHRNGIALAYHLDYMDYMNDAFTNFPLHKHHYMDDFSVDQLVGFSGQTRKMMQIKSFQQIYLKLKNPPSIKSL